MYDLNVRRDPTRSVLAQPNGDEAGDRAIRELRLRQQALLAPPIDPTIDLPLMVAGPAVQAARWLGRTARGVASIQATVGLSNAENVFNPLGFGALRSPNELMGVEPASAELLAAVGSKRSLVIAKPGSEELRMLDYFGAEASVGGVNNSSILLRESPSKAAVLEEFLHGTQARLGIVERLGNRGLGSAETHVKDFMIRHQQMLGLSNEDIRILQILRNAGL
jgi:hypothetical protein